jgi:hypothetical protein
MLRRGAGVLAAFAIIVVACSSFDEAEEGASSSGGNGDAGTDGTIASSDGGDAAASCLDTSTDPKNCGSCGHDCLGGACAGGVCQPFEIGRSSDAPVKSIAVDEQRVFWMTSADVNDGKGNLYQCAKAGCPSGGAQPIIEGAESTGTLASDGVTTYASLVFSAEALKTFAPGSTAVTLAGFDPPGPIFQMESVPPYVYLLAHSTLATRFVYRWKPGEQPTVIGTYVQPDGGALINTFHASFTPSRVFLAAVNTGKILGCDLASCDATWGLFVDDAYSIQSMTNDDQRVYWADQTGSVKSCPADATCNGIADVITVPVLGANAVSVRYSHASQMLVILTSAGEVVECAPSDCANEKRVLAKEPALDVAYAQFNTNVTSDATAVYYVASDASGVHRIMRIAR